MPHGAILHSRPLCKGVCDTGIRPGCKCLSKVFAVIQAHPFYRASQSRRLVVRCETDTHAFPRQKCCIHLSKAATSACNNSRELLYRHHSLCVLSSPLTLGPLQASSVQHGSALSQPGWGTRLWSEETPQWLIPSAQLVQQHPTRRFPTLGGPDHNRGGLFHCLHCGDGGQLLGHVRDRQVRRRTS